MIQGGDPNSKNKPKNTWGYGDPSQTTVPDEFSSLHHVRGILSAASTTNPNSATSQFFICVASRLDLDGHYSIYGQVVKGMDVVDKIVNLPRDANNNPLVKAEMTIVKLDPSDVKDILYNSGDIKIYPNPASDFIGFMSEKSDFLIKSINITDINGINYFTQQYNTYININDIKIPVSKIPVGVYYINMKGNSGIEYNLRFIRE